MYPDASCHPLLPAARAESLADHLASEGFRASDYAPRAAHGRYLAHVLARAEADADPDRLRIVQHAAEAIDVTGPADGAQRVRLSDSRVLTADAVALALGHLPTALGPRSQQLADAADRYGLVHLGPANPLDVDYASLLGREAVAVQGMGLETSTTRSDAHLRRRGVFEPDAEHLHVRTCPAGQSPSSRSAPALGWCTGQARPRRTTLPAPYVPQVLTGERVLESPCARPVSTTSGTSCR